MKKLRKLIEDYVYEYFPEEVITRNFDCLLFPSRMGTDKPLERESI